METHKPLLAYVTWLNLPGETRRKLAVLFKIPRTGEVIVRTGVIINGNISGEAMQDGYAAKDLYAITTEKMQEFLGTQVTDFNKLFSGVIENLDELYEGIVSGEVIAGLPKKPLHEADAELQKEKADFANKMKQAEKPVKKGKAVTKRKK